MRTVFDTNVLVSAVLILGSVPRKSLDAALALGRVLVSAVTMGELEDVLRRPKFDKYTARDKRLQFLAALMRVAEVVDITDVVTDCRDSKDNKFLELAVSGRATFLVTGDADLLVLHPFRGINVVTPQAFLAGVTHSGA